MKSLGYNTIFYIGYCFDEVTRYSIRSLNEKYPLVEEKVLESDILEWAKNVPIFNDYYKYHRRCGCMLCPMATYLELAYLYKYYPDKFQFYIDKMRETENNVSKKLGRKFALKSSNVKYDADYVEHIVKTKWLKKLEDKLKGNK